MTEKKDFEDLFRKEDNDILENIKFFNLKMKSP